MECNCCGIECDYEVILTFGHTQGIDKYTCNSCSQTITNEIDLSNEG